MTQGMAQAPTFWDTLQDDHQEPRSFWEYQCVKDLAQGGAPKPWNQPLRAQKTAKRTKEDASPKNMLTRPVQKRPAAMRYLGLDLSERMPLVNLLTP